MNFRIKMPKQAIELTYYLSGLGPIAAGLLKMHLAKKKKKKKKKERHKNLEGTTSRNP